MKKFFQAEDSIRDVERSRGLGDVYKRQFLYPPKPLAKNIRRVFALTTPGIRCPETYYVNRLHLP